MQKKPIVVSLADCEDIDRTSFDCGVAALNQWFANQAGQAQRKGLARVWVATERQSPAAAIGYSCLSGLSLPFEDAPAALRRRMPKKPLQVILLARLAVDQRHQGRGIGRQLLMDAIDRSWRAASQVPAKALVVHAKDETAAAFYEKYGFLRFFDGSLHLFLPMGTLELLIEGD